MQEYQMIIDRHKKARDPELDPFLIIGRMFYLLLFALILVPVSITVLLMLSVLFFDQQLVFLLLIAFGIIYLLVSVVLANYSYSQLKQFQITGSIFHDLFRLIESFGFRIQAAIFPLIFLLFIFSLLFTGGENGETSDFIGSAIQLFGIAIPFIGVILLLNSFLNYLDDHNGKISSLDDRTPDEDFRQELKNWGRTLGFLDVKIRLADLQPNYFGRVAIGAEAANIVFIGYSKIAQFQAEKDQSLVYCVREICRLSLDKRWSFYLFYVVHNLLFSLYLTLSGMLIFSLSSDTMLIQELNVIFCIVVIVVLIVADAFTKAYISSFDILLELKTDLKTVKVLTTDYSSPESIRRYLRIIEEIDPLMTAYPGFKFRRSALLEKKERRTMWDDL